MRLIIAGTDTEIGKTCLTAALTHALQVAGARVTPIKPLAAGQMQDAAGQWVNEDVQQLHAVQRLGMSPQQVGPLQFREACAPHIAARLEGRRIEQQPHAGGERGDERRFQIGERSLRPRRLRKTLNPFLSLFTTPKINPRSPPRPSG